MSKSQAFYAFLTLKEVDGIVAEALSKYDLTLVCVDNQKIEIAKSLSFLKPRFPSDIQRRAFIVCHSGLLRHPESLHPAPNIILDFPIEGHRILAQTWVAYKLQDADFGSECAQVITSCFGYIVKKFKKLLIGHTVAFFDYDPSNFSEYPKVKYSQSALDLFEAGIEWRQTPKGALFEPWRSG